MAGDTLAAMQLGRVKLLPFLTFFAFVVATLTSATASAQSSSAQGTYTVSASARGTSTQTLPTITIDTGEVARPRARTERKLRVFDLKEESFTEVEVNNQSGSSDTYQKLNALPGVTTRSQGTTAPSISIRGSVKSDRVLSLYNEIPLNTADGLGARKLLVPTELLRPARVYKGPMSTRFGASAMGGAVSFTNRFLKSAEISVHGNSGLQAGGAAIIPLVSEKKYRFQASAYVDQSTGEFDFTNTHKVGLPVETRANNDSFLQRYTLHGQQRLGTWKLKQSLVFANEYGTTPGSVLSPQITAFSTMGGLGSLHIGKKVSQSFLLESQSSFLVTDSDFDNIGNDLPDSELFNSKFNQRLSARLKANRFWQISTGLDFSTNSVESLAGTEDAQSDSQTDVYIFNKFNITRAVSVDIGARRLIDFDTNVFSGEIAHQSKGRKTWLGYRQGYRAPSLSDRFANFSTFVGNPDLEPESSQQIEAGYRLTQKNDYEIEASAFGVFYDNFITNQNLDANRVRPVNQGTARSLGADLSYKQFYRAWAFGLSGTLMNTNNDQTGNSIILTPDAEALLSVAYRLGPMTLTAIQGFWSESLDTDSNGADVVLDGGNRTDFKLNLDFQKWSLSASVENLFDTAREMKFGFPEPQRSFKLGMRYTF